MEESKAARIWASFHWEPSALGLTGVWQQWGAPGDREYLNTNLSISPFQHRYELSWLRPAHLPLMRNPELLAECAVKLLNSWILSIHTCTEMKTPWVELCSCAFLYHSTQKNENSLKQTHFYQNKVQECYDHKQGVEHMAVGVEGAGERSISVSHSEIIQIAWSSDRALSV